MNSMFTKNIFRKCSFVAMTVMLFVGTSCSESFLDNKPDNVETMEEVFSHRNRTLSFLANVYSYIHMPINWSNGCIWAGTSDEIDVTYTDYEISKINLGFLSPDKESQRFGNYWDGNYQGIRAATYYMQHVDENQEMTKEEILKTKTEARALRAWYYFLLVRQYGPVVILGDDLIPADAPVSDMQLSRSTISECFKYIVSECDEVIKTRALADFRDNNIDYGRMTNATMLALKARALLYAASPLYNRDKTLDCLKNLKNNDGTYLLDYTNEGEKQRWEAAAKATKELMEFTPDLKLYDTGDPYESYKNLFIKDWNCEVIWARPAGNFWEQDRACSPRTCNGWSGWGATQEMVDAYFTNTGYPVLEDENGNHYSEDGVYSEEGFSTAAGDDGHTQKGTFMMYCNREPRFYVSIAFDNMKWISKFNDGTVQFYYGGNSGRTANETRNYSQTGYLCCKYVHPESNVAVGTLIEHAAIFFRLGEFYLNYAEALNEISFEQNKETILYYINAIRKRAGIPGYGEGDGFVPTPKNQEEMREAIRRERRVELGFEENRYFDCCRWCVAHKYFNGPKHGMNANDARGKSVFYQRTVFENRVFKDYNAFWPIPLSEIYKDKNLVQNPMWSTVSSDNMEE